MKKLFFLLTLCLMSINIYAQRDTSYCLESNPPVILSIPDSVFNPEASIEQNVLAWQTKKHIFLGSEDRDVIEFDYFKIYEYKIDKFLSFNPITQKNEIIKRTITTRTNYIFEIIFFYVFACLFTLFVFLNKEVSKITREKYKSGHVSKSDYRKGTRTLKYIAQPLVILSCVTLLIKFLDPRYCSYTISELFLPLLIFFLAVITSVIINKFYLTKAIAKNNGVEKQVKNDFVGEDTQA